MTQDSLAFWAVDAELPAPAPPRDRGAAESPDVILIERRAAALALGLPVDGAAIVAWVNPLAFWGARVAGAIACRGNAWTSGRVRGST